MKKWTLEISVDDVWIEDGFNLTEDVAVDMIQGYLLYAQRSEIKVKILKKPKQSVIDKIQGEE